MSNSLDPDQARYFAGLGLGPHCLQSLSAVENITVFSKLTNFRNTIKKSNMLNSDQARHFAGLDLGPNGLQSPSEYVNIRNCTYPQMCYKIRCNF